MRGRGGQRCRDRTLLAAGPGRHAEHPSPVYERHQEGHKKFDLVRARAASSRPLTSVPVDVRSVAARRRTHPATPIIVESQPVSAFAARTPPHGRWIGPGETFALVTKLSDGGALPPGEALEPGDEPSGPTGPPSKRGVAGLPRRLGIGEARSRSRGQSGPPGLSGAVLTAHDAVVSAPQRGVVPGDGRRRTSAGASDRPRVFARSSRRAQRLSALP